MTVALYDINGRELTTLLPQGERAAGLQNERFQLPQNLAAGTYFVLLSTPKGYKAIRFVKG